MSVREAINNKKKVGVGVTILFFAAAAAILVYTQLPAHRIKGDKTYFTDDDGQTWFLDSVYQPSPFEHDGKTAVRAMIYSYDNGGKTFCAYLMRYTTQAKKRLDDAIAEAIKEGKSAGSIELFTDRELNTTGVEVKLPGPGHSWILRSTSDGGQTINTGLSAHADDSSDLVIPE
jgi:hypothetical protein